MYIFFTINSLWLGVCLTGIYRYLATLDRAVLTMVKVKCETSRTKAIFPDHREQNGLHCRLLISISNACKVN